MNRTTHNAIKKLSKEVRGELKEIMTDSKALSCLESLFVYASTILLSFDFGEYKAVEKYDLISGNWLNTQIVG